VIPENHHQIRRQGVRVAGIHATDKVYHPYLLLLHRAADDFFLFRGKVIPPVLPVLEQVA
jgi:hypothetical protein